MEESKGVITAEHLAAIGTSKGWNTTWLSEQLYGILAEATLLGSRAKRSVMALELEGTIHGAKIYRAFAHEHLDGSQKATVTLGTNITKPPMAPMDEFEERLRIYGQDEERYERLSEQKVGELAFVHLQDLIPAEVRVRFENEKHNFTNVADLRGFFEKVIEDYRASSGSKKKPRPLHALTTGAKEEGEGGFPEVIEEGNLLYSLLCHASEGDAAKILGPAELMSFVKWRKGGGKGYSKGGFKGSGGGGKASTWSPTVGTASRSASGTAASRQGLFRGRLRVLQATRAPQVGVP